VVVLDCAVGEDAAIQRPGPAIGAADQITPSGEEEDEEEDGPDCSRADHLVVDIPPSADEAASIVEDIMGEAISDAGDSGAADGQSSIFKETGVKPDGVATTGGDGAEPVVSEDVESVEVPPIETARKRDEELDTLLNRMIRKRILPDPQDRIDVVNYGRKKSAQLLLTEDYDAARDIDFAVDVIFVNMREQEQQQDEVDQNAMLQQRLEKCKSECEKITQSREEAIESKRGQLRKDIAELAKLQEEERRQLEQEWSDPRAKIPFSKPSPKLLQVR
jgi:hypothetical protein